MNTRERPVLRSMAGWPWMLSGLLAALFGGLLETTARAAAPVFTLQPTNLTAAAGSAVELVTAVDGDPVPDLRWQFQGAELPDGHDAILFLYDVHTNQSGVYRLMASNSFGVAFSDE